jgi:putative transposase
MTEPLHPAQVWWTAEEIAAAGLPDMPATKRGVNTLAERDFWRAQGAFARRRAGKGGGWEYHWRLFPARAQRKLLLAASAPTVAPPRDRDQAWSWFDGLPDDVRGKAAERLRIVQEVEAMVPALGKHLAVRQIAGARNIGASTIWNWLASIEGVRPDDRLPHLAPRHRASAAKPNLAECSPEFWGALKSDFLRLSEPAFTDCYRRAVRMAKEQGWETLPERTLRRRLDREVSRVTQVLMRKGIDAVKRLYPPQVRDKTALVAMEAVNGDFHKWDVFVQWPGIEKPVRPQMVAFQDVFSGRILSWRLDISANSTAVLLAAGDMIETWGIPGHVLLDNGREFAAKAVTGGASTRYRFKVKEDDIPGLFTALGCEIHWATPYSGQSKPIERAFGTLCRSVAKDPRFDGAYTGNRPDAKPEDYGSRAVPLETFLSVVAEGIEELNTRNDRRSEVAYGRSFAEVFDESYATAPIRKATEAQRRLWLMGAEGLRADAKSGAIKFQGNIFWDHWLQECAGEQVVIRFDPAAFWDGLHVYSAAGAYLGHAPVRERVGFFDQDEARIHARARSAWLKAEKDLAEAHRRFTAAQLGKMLDGSVPDPTPKPAAKVVKPVFGGHAKPVAADTTLRAVQEGIAIDLAARRPVADEEAETERERFKRALDLERLVAGGGKATPDQRRWLASYHQTPEYRTQRMFWDDLGDALFSG